MQPPREHRSERPAIWDVSNPVASDRQSLRGRLSGRKSRSDGTAASAEPVVKLSLRQRLGKPSKKK